MGKRLIGYMITWTTYGTWLQGREQGFVKDGRVRGENIALKKSNVRNLNRAAVRLGRRERNIVKDVILEVAKRFEQKICAIAVRSNHVHIVAEVSAESIEQVVHRCKYSATRALRKCGVEGKVWTRGYDKRFCFGEKELRARVDYVNKHGESN